MIYMEKYDIIKDISQRTGGDIYLGVVGAVRTGKSTFIKKCIENLYALKGPSKINAAAQINIAGTKTILSKSCPLKQIR